MDHHWFVLRIVDYSTDMYNYDDFLSLKSCSTTIYLSFEKKDVPKEKWINSDRKYLLLLILYQIFGIIDIISHYCGDQGN